MKHLPKSAPASTEILLQRCQQMAGQTVAELARQENLYIPKDLKQSKGWVGQLIECHLGASASNTAQPDFVELGIELKTLPLGADGLPRESTYVCTVPLAPNQMGSWQDSWLRQKLSRVLWVPVEADPAIPLAERTVGNAILWQADEQQLQVLRQDWEELTEMICLGQLEKITSHHGHYLQIRPKAANAKALCPATDEEGNRCMTLPRGFYLRTQFTRQILQQNYAIC